MKAYPQSHQACSITILSGDVEPFQDSLAVSAIDPQTIETRKNTEKSSVLSKTLQIPEDPKKITHNCDC
jgi:hypothetical protein